MPWASYTGKSASLRSRRCDGFCSRSCSIARQVKAQAHIRLDGLLIGDPSGSHVLNATAAAVEDHQLIERYPPLLATRCKLGKVGMNAFLGEHARAQSVVQLSARCAGFEIVEQDACTTHEAWGNLVLHRIVSTHGRDETTGQVQIVCEDWRIGRRASDTDV